MAWAALALVAAAVGAAWWMIERAAVSPRELAPYIEKRSSGHHRLISSAGSELGALLRALDRGDAPTRAPLRALEQLHIGAQPQAAGQDDGAIVVRDVSQLRAAMDKAEPGNVITLAPGRYLIDHRPVTAARPGQLDAPVVVRAQQPGTVELVSRVREAFLVSAPHWRFENLVLLGQCVRDDVCEHAFHVVGAAHHFAAVNNSIGGFNAHFKINGSGGKFPDNGLIASNTLFNPAPRATHLPVTPIDLVAASDWTIRANIIRDFVKLHGNQVSYGAFAKGGGSGNLFERNVVWCESALHNQPGQRVGLSLGGGTTGAQFCRDRRCITEQQGGIVRANLIVGCSSAGIDLNNAAASVVEDNTLIDTAGLSLRDAATSARLYGNLIDGAVRVRDGAVLHQRQNYTTPRLRAYLGSHPVRALFVDAAAGNFAWRGQAPQVVLDGEHRARVDLCGSARDGSVMGAFDDFTRCQRAP